MDVRKVSDLDDRTQEWIKDTFYFVEADHFAESTLFGEYAKASPKKTSFRGDREGYNGLDWDGFSDCRLFHIGYCAEKTVCIQLTWYKIEGKRVCFYTATSQMVYYPMIEEFMTECCEIAECSRTDADNFHQVLHALKDAQEVG